MQGRLGAYIAEKLRERQKTVTALAREAGISVGHASRIVRGYVPSEGTLRRIAAALGVEPEALLRLARGESDSDEGDNTAEGALSPADLSFESPDSLLRRVTRSLLERAFEDRGEDWASVLRYYPMFLVLAGRSRATVQAASALLRSFARVQELLDWFDGFSAHEARLMLHAIMFGRDPAEYAGLGWLRLAKEFETYQPERLLPLPEWVLREAERQKAGGDA